MPKVYYFPKIMFPFNKKRRNGQLLCDSIQCLWQPKSLTPQAIHGIHQSSFN